MVISFSVEEARNHLEKYGFVYTLRPKMRKRCGDTWYNYFRTDTKKGDVSIGYVGDFSNTEWRLKSYLDNSGFESVEDWLKTAKGSRYLYSVQLKFGDK